MSRRNIFAKQIDCLQQGCIFNGAKMKGYEECEVYGLIITPRCDIAQNKVDTVHYLGLVGIEDWKRIYLAKQYQIRQLMKDEAELKELLKKKNIGEHLLKSSYRLTKDDFNKIYGNRQLHADFYKKMERFWDMQNLVYCYDHLSEWKDYKSRLSELSMGRMERFLLLESWSGQKAYYVISLTDINKLEISVANAMANGIKERDVSFEDNDLVGAEDKLAVFKFCAQLTSPYIEYVCQHMSNAFFRVGIEDWPHSNILDLIK